jgi:hypothetical protein
LDKPRIVIEADQDGNLMMQTNIESKLHIRNILKVMEEKVVVDALEKSSVQPLVKPAQIIPLRGKTN